VTYFGIARVTLIFDLLTPKVDLFMLLPGLLRVPLVPIGVKIGSLVFKTSSSQV